VQAGLGGPDGDGQRLGNIREGQAEVEVEDDDGPRLRSKPLEGDIEELAVGDDLGDVADLRLVDWRQLDLDQPPAAMAHGVDARSNDQPTKPGLEAIRIAERGQVPPGADESLLDRVPRELGVPEDQAGRRVEPRDEPAREHGEGVMVAPHRTLDELSLVHDHPR